MTRYWKFDILPDDMMLSSNQARVIESAFDAADISYEKTEVKPRYSISALVHIDDLEDLRQFLSSHGIDWEIERTLWRDDD